MARTPQVYRQGASTYVIGTDDMQAATRVLGITPTTHQWGSTEAGLYVVRQGRWRAVSEGRPTPKDARPGVAFLGRIAEWGADHG